MPHTRSQGAPPPQMDMGTLFVVQTLVRPCVLHNGFNKPTYVYVEGGVFDSYQEAVDAIKLTLENKDYNEVWSDYVIVAHYGATYDVGMADAIRCFDNDGKAYIPKTITIENPTGN